MARSLWSALLTIFAASSSDRIQKKSRIIKDMKMGFYFTPHPTGTIARPMRIALM
jgi:hypothetical protein